MKKTEQHAPPENDADPIIIKNPFLVAKLEKAAQLMGWSISQVVVFFVREGFDKPLGIHTREAETVRRDMR